MVTSPVTLEEFVAHLNYGQVPAAESAERAELELHLAAATRAIENRVGPIVNREITERVAGGRGGVVLGSQPVVELTSLTSVRGTVEWDTAGLYADPAGIVSRLYDATFPAGDYDVVYVAGRGTAEEVPEHLKLAVLIVATHLWETQRGNGVGRSDRWGTPEETSDVPRGFALPRRALELISGEEQIAFA